MLIPHIHKHLLNVDRRFEKSLAIRQGSGLCELQEEESRIRKGFDRFVSRLNRFRRYLAPSGMARHRSGSLIMNVYKRYMFRCSLRD